MFVRQQEIIGVRNVSSAGHGKKLLQVELPDGTHRSALNNKVEP